MPCRVLHEVMLGFSFAGLAGQALGQSGTFDFGTSGHIVLDQLPNQELQGRVPRASFSNGALSVSIHRSAQYEQLHAQLIDTIAREHGDDTLQQVHLHEMVNYLRLIPYQTRTSRTAGLAFFGCLCILLQDYERRYPGDLHKARRVELTRQTAISS